MKFSDAYAIVPLPQAAESRTAFAPVAGEAALVRVVRSLLGPVAPARIVIATRAALQAGVRDCLLSVGLKDVEVKVIPESATRRQAIVAGLEHLGVDVDAPDPVLVGDHRFPLATGAVADRVVAGLRDGHGVVVPTLPMTDTVKAVDHLGSVRRTVDRATLRTVQYPRGYAAATLWNVLSDNGSTSSDEFTAALCAGFAITTVDGDPRAVEVELPGDAQLADAIIASRPD